jgi:hypothetical protein
MVDFDPRFQVMPGTRTAPEANRMASGFEADAGRVAVE